MTFKQKQTIRKTLSLTALIFTVTFSLAMMVGPTSFVDFASSQVKQSDVVQLSTEIDTDWRYTKQGWRQIGELYQDSFAPLRTFESIHPFVWAASVIVAVVGTTVWASSEWEIARFWNQDQ